MLWASSATVVLCKVGVSDVDRGDHALHKNTTFKYFFRLYLSY